MPSLFCFTLGVCFASLLQHCHCNNDAKQTPPTGCGGPAWRPKVHTVTVIAVAVVVGGAFGCGGGWWLVPGARPCAHFVVHTFTVGKKRKRRNRGHLCGCAQFVSHTFTGGKKETQKPDTLVRLCPICCSYVYGRKEKETQKPWTLVRLCPICFSCVSRPSSL